MINTKNIWLQISTGDILKTITTSAQFEDDKITFKDDENQQHIITIKDREIRYQKKGHPAMDFYFSDERTEGTYWMDQQTFIFQIKTLELKIKNDTIRIRYQLRQENEIISTHTIAMIMKD